jgi:PAS domain S-box-containing protein
MDRHVPMPDLRVLDRVPDATYVVDAAHRVVYANEAMEQLLGYARGALAPGADGRALLAPEAAQRIEVMFAEETGAQAPSRRMQLLFRHRAGQWMLLDAAARLSGEPDGSRLAFIRLRPARSPAGVRLPALGELSGVARLFEAIPVGLALIDADRRMVDVNTALCGMLGYRAEELRGHTIGEFTHPDGVDHWSSLAAAIRRGEVPSYQLQNRLVRRDGTLLWVNLHVTAVRPAGAGGTYAFAMIEDITQFKVGEGELRQRIAEQRRALIRETHHRIKNSLQGIVGLLTQQADDNPACAGPIRLAVERIQAVALVHGMCAAPGREFPNCCDVSAAIGAAMRDQYGRSIITSISGSADPVVIHTDELVPYALILTELIANAIKHGAPGGEPILLEIIREKAAVTLSVVSRGARLPAGFDLRRGLGVGTGLSLVKSLLPPRGLELSIFQRDDGVVSRIRLEPPIVSPSGSRRDEGAAP